MSNATQVKSKSNKDEPPLDPHKVKVALAIKGWTQSRLAQAAGCSLTTANLTINHNTFPAVTKRIRKILNL